MMCEEYQELISAFVDGELPDDQSAPVFEHLPLCPECRTFLGVLMKMRKSVAAEQMTFPEELDARILSEIERRRISPHPVKLRGSPIWTRRFSWSVGFAAAVIILAFVFGGVVGSLLYTQRTQEMSSPVQVRLAEQGKQPAAVLIIYSLPEIQSTGIVPAKYERVRSDTIY